MRPNPVTSRWRSFPRNSRLHFTPHTCPPPHPCSQNLLTFRYSPLTLRESTPRFCSNATVSKEPLLWIYIDFYLYYSADISLLKHSLSHSTNVHWAHIGIQYYFSGWGLEHTLKKFTDLPCILVTYAQVLFPHLAWNLGQGYVSYSCNPHNI